MRLLRGVSPPHSAPLPGLFLPCRVLRVSQLHCGGPGLLQSLPAAAMGAGEGRQKRFVQLAGPRELLPVTAWSSSGWCAAGTSL